MSIQLCWSMVLQKVHVHNLPQNPSKTFCLLIVHFLSRPTNMYSANRYNSAAASFKYLWFIWFPGVPYLTHKISLHSKLLRAMDHNLKTVRLTDAVLTSPGLTHFPCACVLHFNWTICGCLYHHSFSYIPSGRKWSFAWSFQSSHEHTESVLELQFLFHPCNAI